MANTGCLPIACDLTVFGDNEKKRQRAILEEFRARVKGTRELDDGYAFQMLHEPHMLALLAEMISLESRCCPFLDFTLEVTSGGHSITLKLTGGEGAKEVVRAEFNL